MHAQSVGGLIGTISVYIRANALDVVNLQLMRRGGGGAAVNELSSGYATLAQKLACRDVL